MLNTVDSYFNVSANAKQPNASRHNFQCTDLHIAPENDSFSNIALSSKTRPLAKIRFSGNAAIGQVAPDFTLKNHAGEPVNLYKTLEEGPVVLFFYPKNNFKFCTKQVQAFRDEYPKFTALHATILGISSDPVKSHQQFIEKQKLPFELLSDPKDKVRKQYDAQGWFNIPGRVTFVINPVTQQINTRYSSQSNIKAHIAKALEGLGELHQSKQDKPDSE